MSAEGRSEAPAVNLNGLVAAYSSDALDLVSPPFQNTRNQVYARELEVVTSELVSVAPDGKAGNLPSQNNGFPPGISADGRFVAFSSSATNLVPDDTNGLEDVFVYDRDQNVIELISRGTDGPSNGASTSRRSAPTDAMSSSNPARPTSWPNQATPRRTSSCSTASRTRMQRVSVASDGTAGNGPSITPNISDDGLVVAFASRAINLVDQATTGAVAQIFVREWQSGSTELASLNAGGAPGNGISFLPALNRDGSQVAFKSEAFNLVPNDTNGVPDVFVRDRPAGTTQRVSVDSFGNQANGLSGGPGISGDGRFVAFASFASNLVAEDTNGQSDVYVYDRFQPGRSQGVIALVSVGLDGQPANSGVSDFPVTMSADGRWIGFASAASNLVPDDINNDLDAFLACNPFDEVECAPPTPTPTPPVLDQCVGDCNGDGQVTVDDLIRMVNIALDLAPICPNEASGGCLAGDADCDCQITVDDIIRGVQNLLQECHDFGDCSLEQHEQLCCEAPPTGTPTATGTAPPTTTPTPPA